MLGLLPKVVGAVRLYLYSTSRPPGRARAR